MPDTVGPTSVAISAAVAPRRPPAIPDYELLRCIGRGSYGDVWLARNVLGELRAVKFVYRDRFADPRPFEREFEGIRHFEPISRSHPSQLHILHVGKNDGAGCFYYVMELADCAEAEKEMRGQGTGEINSGTPAPAPLFPLSPLPLFSPPTYIPTTSVTTSNAIAACPFPTA